MPRPSYRMTWYCLSSSGTSECHIPALQPSPWMSSSGAPLPDSSQYSFVPSSVVRKGIRSLVSSEPIREDHGEQSLGRVQCALCCCPVKGGCQQGFTRCASEEPDARQAERP